MTCYANTLHASLFVNWFLLRKCPKNVAVTAAVTVAYWELHAETCQAIDVKDCAKDAQPGVSMM